MGPGPDEADEAGAWRRLLAESDIRAVTARYCRAVDRMDEAMLRSCYHPGAIDEHGSFSGDVDAYVAWVWPLLAKYRVTMHFLGTQLIEFDDGGDSARVETYGMAIHRGVDDRPQLHLTTGFRFVDRFDRIDGRWAISRRIAVTEWSRINDPAGWWDPPPTMRTGRRDREDPVYWL